MTVVEEIIEQWCIDTLDTHNIGEELIMTVVIHDKYENYEKPEMLVYLSDNVFVSFIPSVSPYQAFGFFDNGKINNDVLPELMREIIIQFEMKYNDVGFGYLFFNILTLSEYMVDVVLIDSFGNKGYYVSSCDKIEVISVDIQS